MMSQAAAFALPACPVLATVYTARKVQPGEPLPQLVQRMLELFDGARSLGEVCARVQIPEAKGLAIVRKLSSLGLIVPCQPVEDRTFMSGFGHVEPVRDLAPRPAAAFSEDEEAFFASEVQAGDEELPPSLGEKVSLFVSDLVLRLRGIAL